MPYRNKIAKWIKEGEGPMLDFKASITSEPKIARSIVAFANSRGGKIVVGVEDKGFIMGVDADQEEYSLLKAANEYCRPAIPLEFERYEVQHKLLLIAYVAESNIKPHIAINKKGKEKIYVRIADECVVPDNTISQLLQSGDMNNLQRTSVYTRIKRDLIQYLKVNRTISVSEFMKQYQCTERSAQRSLLDYLFEGTLNKVSDNTFAMGKWAFNSSR